MDESGIYFPGASAGDTGALLESPGEGAGADLGAPADLPVLKRARLRDIEGPALERRRARAQRDLVARRAWGAEPGPDGAVLLFGFGRATLWRGGAKDVRFPGDAYAASFSPKGGRAALIGDQHIEIVDTRLGTSLARIENAPASEGAPEMRAAHFLSDSEVAVFDGCQLWRVSLEGASLKARPVGPERCARPFPSETGRRWIFWRQDDLGDSGRFAVDALDLDTGESERIAEGRGEPPGLSLFAVSPAGDALCLSRARDRSEVVCLDFVRQREVVAWEGPTDGRLAFSSAGRLAFGAGPLGGERPLIEVDLATLERRTLGALGAGDEWLDYLAPDVLGGDGGARRCSSLISPRSLALEVGLGGGEWEGVDCHSRAESAILSGSRAAEKPRPLLAHCPRLSLGAAIWRPSRAGCRLAPWPVRGNGAETGPVDLL